MTSDLEVSTDSIRELTYECSDFLYREAELLDQRDYQAWFGLLSRDIDYRVPVRVTRERGKDEFTDDYHYYDDWLTLQSRVARLDIDRAYAENPPTRTLRLVSNIRISSVPEDGLVELTNKFILYRGFWNEPGHDLICGERHDRLRKEAAGWRLHRRLVLLAHTGLTSRNLAVLL